jgi:uncharacterized protein YkwD
MRRTLLAVPLVLALLCARPPAALARTSHARVAAAMMSEIDTARVRAGLAPLQPSPVLRGSAFAYAHLLIEHGFFGHLRRIRASSRFHTLGEIIEIHSGWSGHIHGALREWMHSAEHRAVILDPRFRSLGAGFRTGFFRGHRATIWVAHFGA